MSVTAYSRTIPQRLRATFAPMPLDAGFDDVLARLARALDASDTTLHAEITPVPMTALEHDGPCNRALAIP